MSTFQFPRTCFSCGRRDVAIHDVGAANAGFQACELCFVKYGRRALRREADRMLAEHYAPGGTKKLEPPPAAAAAGRRLGLCFHCLDPVLQQPDGRWPLWCRRCEAERQALSRRSRTPAVTAS